MGNWGPGLYQDDVALDTKEYYLSQLRKGRSSSEITHDLIGNSQITICNPDDALSFWLALADTQWSVGRLENYVKEKALECLRDGNNLKRWEDENRTSAIRRTKVFNELEHKLLSPQPGEKMIQSVKCYKCEWLDGDVFAYRIENQNSIANGLFGRYFLLQKIGETIWEPDNIIPICRVKITKTQSLPTNMNEFNALEYVQTSLVKYEHRFYPLDGSRPIDEQIDEKSSIEYVTDEYGYLPVYTVVIITTSWRSIPKRLMYLGNFHRATPPINEYQGGIFEQNGIAVFWKDLESRLTEAYIGHNMRERDIYKKAPSSSCIE
jgi:hypothetical protein